MIRRRREQRLDLGGLRTGGANAACHISYNAALMKRPAAMSAVGSTTAVVIPILAVIMLGLAWGRALTDGFVAIIGVLFAVCVPIAVHHARAIAQRVCGPFGSLVLAVASTVLLAAPIMAMMMGRAGGAETLARDAVFGVVIIACNGILGLSLLVAARRTPNVCFDADGPGAALATVATFSALTLVLPSFVRRIPGLQFSLSQIAFMAVTALVLYGLFIALQAPQSRDYYLAATPTGDSGAVATVQTRLPAIASVLLLLLALVAAVGSAMLVLPTIGGAVVAAGLPAASLGAAIALLILLPEAIAAVRAARGNRVQASLNIAFGSLMASIGLTIPTIAIASIWLPVPLRLALAPSHIVLLALTLIVTMLTVLSKRATLPQSGVHLALLVAYAFVSINA